MSVMEITTIPAFSAGCRLHPTQNMLLIPEGTLELSGPTRDVLTRVDGKRNVAAIVEDLLVEDDGAPAAEVQADVLNLRTSLEQRGVVRMRA